MTRTTERVLATIDWAHYTLSGSDKESGHAMDAESARLALLYNSAPKTGTTDEHSSPRKKRRRPQNGLYARYLRGDTTPGEGQLRQFDGWADGSWARFYHPIYRVTHATEMEWTELVGLLHDLAVSLNTKLFSVDGPYGSGFHQLPVNSRRLIDLTVQGDGYALTALLVYVRHLANEEDQAKAMEAATRAFQCMVFAFARGEFKAIRSALSARIRQQILDRVAHDGQALDTASVNIEAGISAVRQLLQEHSLLRPNVNPVARRHLFRQVLAGQHGSALLLAITPERVSIGTAMQHRLECQRPIEMDSEPSGRFNHVRRFGRKAREVLRRELADYWIEPCLIEPRS